MNPLTRRQFLQTSAAAATGTALGAGCATKPKPYAPVAAVGVAASAHAAGSDVLKVGMIGCGGRNAGAALEALNADPGARLVAACDIFMDRIQDKLAAIRKERPDQVQVERANCFTGFEGYQGVIAASDVVVIANAAKFHPLHTLAAVQAGRHVFVEKPHGIDPLGIKVLQRASELAREKGLSIVSGLQSRYHPGYHETIQRIRDGQIGDIVTLEEVWLRPPYGLVARRPGLTELLYQCSNQYHFNWLSGDDVVQTLVHNLDRASWVMGDTAPVRCRGMGGRSGMFGEVYGNVFDHHSMVYEFANGVRLYASCRTTSGCYDEANSYVFGTKGRAIVTASRITGERPWRYQGPQVNPYQVEHDRLFAAIRSGQPLNNGDYAARSTLITIMGQLACYTGREITWDFISNSDWAYQPLPEQCRDDMEPPVRPGPDGQYPVERPGSSEIAKTLFAPRPAA